MSINNKNKYAQLPVKKGMPNPAELKEGIAVYRYTNKGIVQFIKYNGQLYSNQFKLTKQLYKNKINKILGQRASGGSFEFKEGFKIVWGEITSDNNATQTFSFFDNFKRECFGVFLNPQVEEYRDPVDAFNIKKDSFQINRVDCMNDCTINYLAIGI